VLMRRWDLPADTQLCAEGSPGGTCFVLVSGTVNVTIRVRGQPQLLAQLAPGSIFGQVSLVDGEPRTATCTVSRSAVLAELATEPCKQLFASRSPTAFKWLGALNQGLISALQGADKQLMKLNLEGRMHWSRDRGPEAGTPPSWSEERQISV